MLLSNQTLISLSELAKKAALKAGNIITDAQNLPIKVKTKKSGESIASRVLTETDIKAETAILEVLMPTLQKYNLGLLTEETIDDQSRFKKDYFWCIDPLDGTLAFSQNQEGYCTSIALVSKFGFPIMGVVYDPRSKNLYSAMRNNGSFKNHQEFKIKEISKKLTVIFDQSYSNHHSFDSQIEYIKKTAKTFGLHEVNLLPLGGAVMNALSTVQMAPALYFKLPKKIKGGGSLWDFAASSIIHSEAGGFNSDFNQEPLQLNKTGSTFMNEKGIIYSSSKELIDCIRF